MNETHPQEERQLTYLSKRRSHTGNGSVLTDATKVAVKNAKIRCSFSHRSLILIRVHVGMASWHLRSSNVMYSASFGVVARTRTDCFSCSFQGFKIGET